MCNTVFTFKIFRYNSCNIQKKRQKKHLKQASETYAKMPENIRKTIANICNILDETLINIRMKHLKTLETYACNIQIKTLATFIWNR
jgi:hypothetical protein